MEVDNLIELSSEGCNGASGHIARDSAQPAQRKLLVKVDGPPSRALTPQELAVSPKRTGLLNSLGDDASILDAILGNILNSEVLVQSNSRDEVGGSVESDDPPLPSAPPLDQDWQAAGPSSRSCSSRSSPSVEQSSLSRSSSTISLRHLDFCVGSSEETSFPQSSFHRTSSRATVIGGVPLDHRARACTASTTQDERTCGCHDERCLERISSHNRTIRTSHRAASTAARRIRSAEGATSAARINMVPKSIVPNVDQEAERVDEMLSLEVDVQPAVRAMSPSRDQLSPRRSLEGTPLRPRLYFIEEPPSMADEPLGSTRPALLNLPLPARATAAATAPPSQPADSEMDRDEEGLSPMGQWPHSFSNSLACLACTLGIFNISRFAILSVQFGANFIVQFFVMSIVLGIPLFTFHVALGQLLGAGTMDMWKISPIFQGIGVALIISQALLGIYSIVGVSWMLVYFRDSFITRGDAYRWAEPYIGLIDGTNWRYNSSLKIEETVADYFSGVVLQRQNVDNPANTSSGTLKFQLTFNLAVVWMIVFIALSKGLKSYGKVVFLFSLLPILGMVFMCVKIMGVAPTYRKSSISFPQTDWSEFFLNSKSWSMAMSEAFYTWGLLGASAMQMASHNRPQHLLHKDTNIVTAITFAVLMLSAFLANTCAQLLHAHGYIYTPSSFERSSSYGFLQPMKTWSSGKQPEIPARWMSHNLYLAGDRIVKPGSNQRQQSGYQALRLATELMPATLAVIGSERLSPFWSVVFYFIMILFGIGQQLAIMHSIITGIVAIKVKTMKSWETTITFFACVCGFILGLPMATEWGIFVVYFMDFCVGGSWWIVLLYLVELMAVFLVRGRPYSGETVVAELFKRAGPALQHLASPMLSFTWNVILPIILMILTVSVFKTGNYRELLKWGPALSYDYWPSWSKIFGTMLQIIPLLMIPFVAVFQTCRYLSKGPPDIFDRIELLYRPPGEVIRARDSDAVVGGGSDNGGLEIEVTTEASAPPAITTMEDPPPKYTPPPSYTTATGARIAKLLRQSFRRSIRRLVSSTSGGGDGGNSSQESTRAVNRVEEPPPPDYAAVLVEMNESSTATSPSTPNVVSISMQSSSPFAQMTNIARNSFRRAMQDRVAQSTSFERLVDSEVTSHVDHIVPHRNLSDKTPGVD